MGGPTLELSSVYSDNHQIPVLALGLTDHLVPLPLTGLTQSGAAGRVKSGLPGAS